MSAIQPFQGFTQFQGSPDDKTSVRGNTWRAGVRTGERDLVSAGYRWVGGACLIFLLWGVFFPLSSAVVAPGAVISKGRNQLLQHPIGGVIEEISARNGAVLAAGDPIVRIEPSAARAQLAKLRARQTLLEAQRTRLSALRDAGNRAFEISDFERASLRGVSGDVSGQPMPGQHVKFDETIHAEQWAAFDAGLKQSESEISALRNRRIGQQDELAGLRNQISIGERKLTLLENDLAKMEPLVRQGYISRTRYNEKNAIVLGESAQLEALKARAGTLQAQIAETDDTLSTLIARKNAEDAQELSGVLADLAAVEEELEAAQTALAQTVIRAPVQGILVKFEANTVGGVIEASRPFGEIVPSGTDVLVEARVSPQDIDSVVPGQSTEIVVTAFKRGQVDPLPGYVTYVAADSKQDEMTGDTFFEVQVALDTTPERARLAIQPGMLSEVYIKTGSRSFFGYLFEPVTDSFLRAFREP